MSEREVWIDLAEILPAIIAVSGSADLGQRFLRAALVDGRVRSKAKFLSAAPGSTPRAASSDEELPSWFWKLARIDWSDLTKPIVHRLTHVMEVDRKVLPYTEAHLVRLRAQDINKVWPEINLPPPYIDRSAALLQAPSASLPRRRGPVAETRKRIVAEMKLIPINELQMMKEEAMASTFGASRDTCRKAREEILSKIVDG